MEIIPWIGFVPQILRQLSVYICFAYLMKRYWRNDLAVLLILMFFPSTFMFFGSAAHNVYKILMLGMTFYCVVKRNAFSIKNTQDTLYTVAFGIFTIAFFISVSVSGGGKTLTIIFSQFARYVETYLLFFIIRDAVYKRGEGAYLTEVLYQIILMQIVMSVVKLIVFRGAQFEGLVGSLSFAGGAMGTSLPILGFMILFFYRNGRLERTDWLFVAGLMLIGYTTGKRAIWFILPLVIAAFLIYVRGIRLNKYLILGICAVPIVFYFGARLTPSLNPDNKVWGRFDLDYVFNYAETYQFGKEGIEGYAAKTDGNGVQINSIGGNLSTERELSTEGRGGATIALFKFLFLPEYKMQKNDIYGVGFSNMYNLSYADFGKLPLSITTFKGSATGLFQTYVTTGYLGIFTTIFFCFMPFFFIKHRRLRWVLLAVNIWEYFMYTGFIFRTPGFMAVMFLLIFYSNLQYQQAQHARRLRNTSNVIV